MGIYTVAIGGNRLGAAEAGVRIRRQGVLNFVLCSLVAGFVGIIEAVRAATTTPDHFGANVILFQAIGAAVIGGTPLTGRIGHRDRGVHRGDLPRGPPGRPEPQSGVSANYFYFYLGLAILIAMAFNV